MKPEILFEDDDLIVVNKPAGLLVIPDRFNDGLPSLNKVLEQHYNQHIYVVHRLDRATSGVICFAKNEAVHKYLSNLFQKHEVEKYYIGLVTGRVVPESGTISSAITEHPTKKGTMITAKRGKPSITDYNVIKEWPLHTLLGFRIHTGRTHQIRVHMQSIGHPIVADDIYSDGKPFFLSDIKRKYVHSGRKEERPLLSRLALHSSRLVFKKENGEKVDIEVPLPKDMDACVKQLDKWSKTL